MKFNSLILLLIFVGLTAFNISETFEMNNPSVKIVSKETKIHKPGDVVIFSVKLCSADNLKSFKIQPNIPGTNEDSELLYNFNGNIKHATVNYYYVVPKNFKNYKDLAFEFTLQDSKKTVKSKKNIKI